MAKVYLPKERYDLELKFEWYQKKFLEAFKKSGDYYLAKEAVFILWPEYRELFQAVDFPEYMPQREI
jgi:hypothetical protein